MGAAHVINLDSLLMIEKRSDENKNRSHEIVMKSIMRHADTGRGQRSKSYETKGVAYIELLLVVAIAAFIGSGALRSFAKQDRSFKDFEQQITASQIKESSEWTLVAIPEGGWAWVRSI